jgi:glutathione synthase/RimK-type ligase-like ATP-grasp enzyme
MKGYNDFNSVEEFLKYYHLEPITESKKEKVNTKDTEEQIEDEQKEEGKVIKNDKLPVVYADMTGDNLNIFKHIIVFTNDRDPENNKTLKNIFEAIENLKKSKEKNVIIPELHVFVAAKMIADDLEEKIILDDGKEHFEINSESNVDTLIFSRLGVQGEDQCEHIVQLLQDRGFLVLNPIRYSELASDKYQTAVLLEKGGIPQPNYSLMTKEILYDEERYDEAMKAVYPEWDSKDNDKNENLDFVVKILDGHGGTGVSLVNGKRILAILQTIFAIDPERQLLLQKKEEADGGDIRVHVLTLRTKQVILAAMKRIKIKSDFRSNVSLGATAEPVKLTPEQEQIALKTAQLSKLPWCAVDIMPLVKGSNPELGDNVVLEINASPGTSGISEVMKDNFINVLLSELDDPSEFMLQDKIAGFIESVDVKFDNKLTKKFLAKLDTGNSASAATLEVGAYEVSDDEKTISFSLDGHKMQFNVIDSITIMANNPENDEEEAETRRGRRKRYVICIPELTLGLRKIKKVKVALVKSREQKTTNMLLNRDILSKLGYVVHPNNSHMLTPEMQKVKII